MRLSLTPEHYFEMSKKDATRSLEIYRRFCFQTENFVAFLDSAKRHSSQLRQSIPNLKHAPISLAKALEEYLHETDFSQHESSRQSEAKSPENAPPEPQEEPKESQPQDTTSSKKALQDFFEALEQPQSTPFNSAYSGFTSFQTQPDWFGLHPMATGMMPQVTGNPFISPQYGFMQPQGTGINPFTPQMQMTPHLTGQPAPFRAPQQQPLVPQHTMNTTPFDSIFGQLSLQPTVLQTQPTGMETQAPSMPMSPPSWTGPSSQKAPVSTPTPQIQQRVEVKESSKPSTASSDQQRLRPQKTGTMNPFSIPSDFEEPEPVQKAPPQPTLNELAMNAWSKKPSQENSESNDSGSTLMPQRTGLLGSVASEFVRPPSSVMARSSEPKTVEAPTNLGSQVYGAQQNVGQLPNQAGSATLPGEPSNIFRTQHTKSPEMLPMSAQTTGVGLGISGSASPAMQGMHQHGLHAQTTGINPLSRYNAHSTDPGYAQLKAQRTGTSAFAGAPSSRQNSLGGTSLQSPSFGAFAGQSGLPNSPGTNFGHNIRLRDTPGNAGSSAGSLFPHPNNSLRLGMSPGLDHQSQIASLTGIKPFQPSSDFGTSLLHGTPQQPAQQTLGATDAPVPDLLQL